MSGTEKIQLKENQKKTAPDPGKLPTNIASSIY